MNRALRRRHLWLVLALALVASGVLFIATTGRRPLPSSVLPPAEVLP